MPFGENSTQLLHTASGALVGLVVLVASAAYFLGIGLDQPEQFLRRSPLGASSQRPTARFLTRT